MRLKVKHSWFYIYLQKHIEAVLSIAAVAYLCGFLFTFVHDILKVIEFLQSEKVSLTIIEVVLNFIFMTFPVFILLMAFYCGCLYIKDKCVEYSLISRLPASGDELERIGIKSAIEYALFINCYLLYRDRHKNIVMANIPQYLYKQIHNFLSHNNCFGTVQTGVTPAGGYLDTLHYYGGLIKNEPGTVEIRGIIRGCSSETLEICQEILNKKHINFNLKKGLWEE